MGSCPLSAGNMFCSLYFIDSVFRLYTGGTSQMRITHPWRMEIVRETKRFLQRTPCWTNRPSHLRLLKLAATHSAQETNATYPQTPTSPNSSVNDNKVVNSAPRHSVSHVMRNSIAKTNLFFKCTHVNNIRCTLFPYSIQCFTDAAKFDFVGLTDMKDWEQLTLME